MYDITQSNDFELSNDIGYTLGYSNINSLNDV